MKHFATIALAGLLASASQANNIQVTNPVLVDNAGSAMVQFDLSWENSWRGGGVANWDAAWVFIKYKTASGLWQHAYLGNTGHVSPPGGQIDPGLVTVGAAYDANTNPVVGVFVRRSADGSGTFALNGVQLKWTYGAQGLGYNDITAVQVFAIEMVYANQAAFAAGDGVNVFSFTLTTINTGVANTAPAGSGTLGGAAGGYPTNETAPNAAWPNGFGAFYVMKYFPSQQQYVDFLNTLTRAQQDLRAAADLAPNVTTVSNRFVLANSAAPTSRNGVACASTVPAQDPVTIFCDLNANGIGNEANDGQWIACNYLSFDDLATYLDWSGLRPLTTMEFEKYNRGPLPPMMGQFIWGNTSNPTNMPYTLNNPGTANENIATNYSTNLLVANAVNSSTWPNGPLRVGILAAHTGNSGRSAASAGYYGTMDYGMMEEMTVGLGNALGRAFMGTHGNGALAATGLQDVPDWQLDGSAISRRGNSYLHSSLAISFPLGVLNTLSSHSQIRGGRGGRTAP